MVEIIFIFILDFLLEEEFLWERTNNSVPVIKQFCVNFITEKIFSKNKEEKYVLQQGINHFTIDFLECKNYLILN